LTAVFALWYGREKAQSLHCIYSAKRELFYWAAMLLTFALSTAVGYLLSQTLAAAGLGLGTVGTSAVFLITTLIFYCMSNQFAKYASVVSEGN